jgi:hypothetical protein
MVSHMVFLTKLGFENLKNLVSPSHFCKVRRVTELLDGRVTSSPWKTNNVQGLDDDFGLKKQTIVWALNMCIFLGQKKYGIWGDFSEKFQVLGKNPDEVTRFDGTACGAYACNLLPYAPSTLASCYRMRRIR